MWYIMGLCFTFFHTKEDTLIYCFFYKLLTITGAENANLYDLKLRSSVALYTEDTDTPAWWANFEKDLLSEFSKR